MSPIVKDFMAKTKIKCEAGAKKFAALELACWDEKHEQELKQFFGFTDESLKKRKKELFNKANVI